MPAKKTAPRQTVPSARNAPRSTRVARTASTPVEDPAVTRVLADFVLHHLASVVVYPKSYRGKGTPAGWDAVELHDISLAAKDGKIVWFGPAADLSDRVRFDPKCRFLPGQGLVAVPGFVDAHTHLVYAGDRSHEFGMRVAGRPYLDILAAGGGILRTVNAVRAVGEDELFEEAFGRAWEAIESGVTTIEIKSGYGLDLENEMKILRVIARLAEELPVRVIPTFMGAHAIPVDRKANPEAFVKEICQKWIPEVARSGLACFNDVFAERKAFSVEQARRILEAGLEHGLQPKIHADEVNVLGGVDLAVELGAVSADHLLKTDAAGIGRMAKSGVIPVLLPGTSTYLMESHHAPARQMIEAGLPVAIASDHNPGSSQFLAAPLIQTLAMLQLRLTSAEALVAGTLHAAHAIGLGDEIGAIEVGRRCDLALFELPSFHHIGYRAGQCRPAQVIIDGLPVL